MQPVLFRCVFPAWIWHNHVQNGPKLAHAFLVEAEKYSIVVRRRTENSRPNCRRDTDIHSSVTQVFNYHLSRCFSRAKPPVENKPTKSSSGAAWMLLYGQIHLSMSVQGVPIIRDLRKGTDEALTKVDTHIVDHNDSRDEERMWSFKSLRTEELFSTRSEPDCCLYMRMSAGATLMSRNFWTMSILWSSQYDWTPRNKSQRHTSQRGSALKVWYHHSTVRSARRKIDKWASLP